MSQQVSSDDSYRQANVLVLVIITSFTSICGGIAFMFQQVVGYEIVIFNPFTDALSTQMNWTGSQRAFNIAVATTLLPIGAMCSCFVVTFLVSINFHFIAFSWRLLTLRISMSCLIIGSFIVFLLWTNVQISFSFFFAEPQRSNIIFAIMIGRLIVGCGIGLCFATVPLFSKRELM